MGESEILRWGRAKSIAIPWIKKKSCEFFLQQRKVRLKINAGKINHCFCVTKNVGKIRGNRRDGTSMCVLL